MSQTCDSKCEIFVHVASIEYMIVPIQNVCTTSFPNIDVSCRNDEMWSNFAIFFVKEVLHISFTPSACEAVANSS